MYEHAADSLKWHLQVHLQLQEPQSSQMKALRSSLEKARELKLNNQAMEGNAGGVDKSQQQMIMELYQKCATLKVCLAPAILLKHFCYYICRRGSIWSTAQRVMAAHLHCKASCG